MGSLFEGERGRIWVTSYAGVVWFENGRWRTICFGCRSWFRRSKCGAVVCSGNDETWATPSGEDNLSPVGKQNWPRHPRRLQRRWVFPQVV